MKMRMVILILYFVLPISASAQQYFNKFIFGLEQNNHSRLYDAYTDSNLVFVLGDLYDTITDPLNPELKPWFGSVNYDGHLITQKILNNFELNGSIIVRGSRMLKNKNGNLLFYAQFITDDDLVKTILLELSKINYSIVNSKIFNNPINPNEAIVPGWLTFSSPAKDTIIIGSTIQDGIFFRSNISLVNPEFEVISNIIVTDNGRNNFTYNIELHNDSTFTLIGESWKRNDTSLRKDVKPFFMKIKINGEIIKFTLANGVPDKTVLMSTSDSYTISKDGKGNWLFAAITLWRYGACGGCYYSLPYVFSYNSDFSVMNWAKCFSEDRGDVNQDHTIYAANYDSISKSLVVVGNNARELPNSSYVFKIKENGDSLWLNHYIPLSWDPENVTWAILTDIQVSPSGSYILVGQASSFTTSKWFSWILHIDSLGCIEPNCQFPVSTNYHKFNNGKTFILSPNPTSEYVLISNNSGYSGEVVITLLSYTGKMIESNSYEFQNNENKILYISNNPPGMYLLKIADKNGKLIQSEALFIK